ncbi:MAG: hypothetical protein Q9211_005943 [Gyalolechia sp. 1 TL-2023]
MCDENNLIAKRNDWAEEGRSWKLTAYFSNDDDADPARQPNRIYYEPFPEPLPEIHDHQPADTSAFELSFAHAPRPPHPDQSIRLPGINTITQDLSPVDRSSSRYSWDSAGPDSLFADFWPDLDHPHLNSTLDTNGFVDLTTDSPPPHPTMAPVTRKRRASAIVTPAPASPQPNRTNKRREVSDPRVKNEGESQVERIDLMDVENDSGLSRVLEQQQAAAIQEQQGRKGDEPTKLSSIQCIICMEPMTDMTVTHCAISGFVKTLIDGSSGHLFCHTCIMEALIAGENQGEPGKATGKCPVCRKKVSRPKEKSRDKREVIPLEIKCVTRASLVKGKAKA